MTGRRTRLTPRRGKSPAPLPLLVEFRVKMGASDLYWFAKGVKSCQGHLREDDAEACAIAAQLKGIAR